MFVDERGKKREKEKKREKHRSVASCMYPTGDQTYNLGMCPDGESNLRPFGLWDDTNPLSHNSQEHNLRFLNMV